MAFDLGDLYGHQRGLIAECISQFLYHEVETPRAPQGINCELISDSLAQHTWAGSPESASQSRLFISTSVLADGFIRQESQIGNSAVDLLKIFVCGRAEVAFRE